MKSLQYFTGSVYAENTRATRAEFQRYAYARFCPHLSSLLQAEEVTYVSPGPASWMVRAASKKPWALHLRQPLCDVADALRTCRHGALSSTACGLTVVMPTMGAPACSQA